MSFKYFDRPDLFVGFQESLCDFCSQTKLCFDASAFYGEETIRAICPDCLAGGKLLDREISTCEGDIDALKSQLKKLNPDWGNWEIEAKARQKTDELEKTTPKIISWQDWPWPCADGDYCRFIGYGSRPFYDRLAGGRNGEKLFRRSIHPDYTEDAEPDELWVNLPRQEIKNYQDSSDYGTLFYVFQSLHSDKILTVWDSE